MRAERRTRKSGAGIEFADHRDYTPGDDLRYLDWGVYGRLGRLLVRLFEEEEDLYVYVLLDASASMDGKLDQARRIVAALAYVALGGLDRVSVLTLDDDLRTRLPPARGKGRIFKVLEFLRAVEARGATDLAKAIGTFVHQYRRRGVAVLVSDFFDPAGFEAGVNLLRHHRFEPLAIQVVDGRDGQADLIGDLEIVDRETGQARQVTVTPALLARIERAHRRWSEELESFCAARDVPCFRADVDEPFEDLLLRVMRRGGLVR